ncbi:MAG: hypothetical protein Q9225_000373 [Loekoesia sp. 1 TL-2023]
MNNKDRTSSVHREDVLTSRGANPRTGVISPYILGGASEAGDETDYVHIGWVQKERESTACPNERWRQDDLGWNLVEGASVHSDSEIVTTSSSDPSTADAAQDQIELSTARVGDMNLQQYPQSQRLAGEHRKTDQSILHDASGDSVRGDGDVSSHRSTSSLAGRRVPSGSLFQIPRKAVGSKKGSQTVPLNTSQLGVPISGLYRENMTSKDKASQSFLSTYLDNTALGFHAYPSANHGNRGPNRDQTFIPKARQRYGSLGVCELDRKNQGLQPSDRYVSSHQYSSPPFNPNLETTYRRPKELLPARLREHPTLHSATHVEHSNNETIHRESVIEQRPNIKRVLATTTVPVTKLVKHTENTRFDETDAPLSFSREKAPFSHHRDRAREEATKACGINASTCAARKAFHNTQASTSYQETLLKPFPTNNAEQNLSSLNRGFVSNIGVRASPNQRIPKKQNHTLLDNSPTAAGTDLAERAGCNRSLGHRRSIRDTKEVFDSLLAVAKELGSLFDFDRVQKQLSNMIRQAALTFHHAPWAIRTLRSQNAKVWDYLLAVRHVLMAVFYLVMLLSVLAAVLKVLKLLAEIGRCFWWPVGLLFRMVRWIVLQ